MIGIKTQFNKVWQISEGVKSGFSVCSANVNMQYEIKWNFNSAIL